MHSDHTTSLKVCTKCREAQPATVECFGRDSKRVDGLNGWCKACQRAYRVANRDQRLESKRRYRASNKERISEYGRVYSAANKERIDAYKREWYAANKEREDDKKRKYIEANKGRVFERGRSYRAANKERLASRRSEWYAANKERLSAWHHAYYVENKERVIERTRRYYAANPDKVRAGRLRRRARIAQAEGTHTATDIQVQYERQKGKCYWCNERVGSDYHVDHIVPLARGGSNWPENLVIACPTCNLSKHDKLPHEWPQGGRLL